MTVLHGVIASPTTGHGAPDLLLWGERDVEADVGGRSPRRKRSAPGARAHPGAISLVELGNALDALRSAGVEPLPTAQPDELRLRLPTRGASPVPSWDLDSRGRGPVAVETWTVPAMRLGLGVAVPWLATLPAGPTEAELPRQGPVLRYAAHLAKFVLSLLARHRFLPTVQPGEGGTIRGEWAALLLSPEDLEVAADLHRSMPPALWAVEARDGRPADAPKVRDLLDGALDAVARAWLEQDPPGDSGGELPEERWIGALASSTSAFTPASPTETQGLVEGFRTWSTGLWTPSDGSLGFRVCFRLDAPRVTDDPKVQPLAWSPPGRWRLRVHLQARDDPSILIPPQEIFASTDDRIEHRGRAVEHPQETVLAELVRAVRVYPALAPLLELDRPEGVPLSLEEAYVFLRDGAPRLLECGFGVRTPPWWGSAQGKLAARVEAIPKEDDEAVFGLAGLLRYDLKVALGDVTLSIEELEGLASLKVPLVRWRGQWVELRPEDAAAALRAIERAKRGSLTVLEALRSAAAGTLDGLPLSTFQVAGPLGALWDPTAPETRMEPVNSPPGFGGSLRPYQTRGLAWAAFLRRFGLGGCLADDMGLGKTVQTLALRLHSRAEGPRDGPWLLVAPTSVVTNWRREAERFAPDLRVHVHQGVGRATGEAFADLARTNDLVVTSYALLWRDEADLGKVGWDTVVLDEAQNIKNPLSKAAQVSRRLRARHRLALTGTPVENRLTELWSLFEFLNPGYLGPVTTFQEVFARPVERFGDEGAAQRLRALVRPLVLRRLKTDPTVAPELPPKIEQAVFCHLTPEQATLYEATVADMLDRIAKADGMERRGLILAALTKLKQVCDHPALLLHDRSAIPGRSGKLERLEAMLSEALEEGDRALIFTQYAEMGGFLRARLAERFHIDVPFLHGGLSALERDLLVQRFGAPDGPALFVLSLKAGGSGLNLSRANRVFHFDRWWNPAVEDQATDRAHRIGQKETVTVYKFVTEGTLEERIEELLKKKRGLAERVLAAGEAGLTELSTAELRKLLALRRDAALSDPLGEDGTALGSSARGVA